MKLIEPTPADKVANPLIAETISEICDLRDQIHAAGEWRRGNYHSPTIEATIAEVLLSSGCTDAQARNWFLLDFVKRKEEEIVLLNARIFGLTQTRDIASGRLPAPAVKRGSNRRERRSQK